MFLVDDDQAQLGKGQEQGRTGADHDPRLAGGAMIQGLTNALGVLKESVESGEVIERPDLVASFQEQNELMGLNEILDLDHRFSTNEQRKEKYERDLGDVKNVLKRS